MTWRLSVPLIKHSHSGGILMVVSAMFSMCPITWCLATTAAATAAAMLASFCNVLTYLTNAKWTDRMPFLKMLT